MKILSRDFTVREKALILVLVLILMALAYYQFVDQPIREAISNAHSERDALQVELAAVDARVNQLEAMQQELDSIDENDSVMASYNNSRAELALLNSILADAWQYSVEFADVTRNGDQIRRDFTLQFVVSDYGEVERMLSQLTDSEYRCLIGNLRCGAGTATGVNGSGSVTVNATATFYETMVGGTADAGLPEDKKAA